MKVLIPLDESAESREIVVLIAPMAKALGATVTLFASIEPVPDPAIQRIAAEPSADLVGIVGLTSPDLEVAEPVPPEWVESKERAVASAQDEARDYLAPVAESLLHAGIVTSVEVVMAANTAEAIVGFAQRQGVDMIAITAQTHGPPVGYPEQRR